MNTRNKKIVFKLMLVALLYGAIEILSFITYSAYFREWFSFATLDDRRAVIRGKAAEASGLNLTFVDNRIIHPFMGHIYLPDSPVKLDIRSLDRLFDKSCTTNRHGFFGPGALAAKTADQILVVVAGGSLSNLVFCNSRAVLAKRLGAIPRFEGKQIVFVGFTFCGFKQPQQLMALSYYLAHGRRPDIVINLDGFNEVASRNLNPTNPNQEYPMYPEYWSRSLGNYMRRDTLLVLGKLTSHKEKRHASARKSWYERFSVLGNLIWAFVDRVHAVNIAEARHQLMVSHQREDENSFLRLGPRLKSLKGNREMKFNAETWFNASVQIGRLARSNGFAYFHFLQPNGLLAEAKRLTTEEKSLVDVGSRRYFFHQVRKGYPILRKLAARFDPAEVTFHDLSALFKDIDETLMADDCCHFNRRGDDLIAAEIGRVIAEKLKGSRPAVGGP